jgi:hypothetical protein
MWNIKFVLHNNDVHWLNRNSNKWPQQVFQFDDGRAQKSLVHGIAHILTIPLQFQATVFWVVMPHNDVELDLAAAIFRMIVGILLHHYMASHIRRPQPESSLLTTPQFLCFSAQVLYH